MHVPARFASFIAGCLCLAPLASSQVVFAPVQSQYRTEHETYYYAGSSPSAHANAQAALECFYSGRYSRVGVAGLGYVHRNLIGRPPEYVVSDCAPLRNAAALGYTAVDARNEAYDRVPRFFRMAELLTAAVPAGDGTSVVPADAPGTISIRAYVRPRTDGSAVQPRPVLIIPKKALEAPATPVKQVVFASR